MPHGYRLRVPVDRPLMVDGHLYHQVGPVSISQASKAASSQLYVVCDYNANSHCMGFGAPQANQAIWTLITIICTVFVH